MKYNKKCPCCNRMATQKFRGIYFCDDCLKIVKKEIKEHKINGVFGEKLIGSFGQGCPVYTDIIIPFK